MSIFEMKDQLSQINRNLATIEQRVTPSVGTRPVSYTPRVTLGSPGSWLEDFISKWVGPLAGLYKQLVDVGIITPAQAEQGLSKEELIELIKAMQPKPWWESPLLLWLPVMIGVSCAAGATVYYLAKKPKK